MNSFLKKILQINQYSKNHKIQIIAHRGAAGYAPENTMISFRKALDLKADYIELDIQMTKDGEIVVIHDATVDRTTNGTGNVRDFTYEEIRKLDAGQWFHKKFSGQQIPTFQEVITEFHGKVGFLIEIKNANLYPSIAVRLAAELKKNSLDHPNHNEIIVQSFDFEFLEEFNKLAPTIPLGLLVKYRVQGISNVQLKEWSKLVQYINPNKALVTRRLVKKIHDYHMQVMPYTARDMKAVKALKHAKVDGIITDFPDYI
ncbi:glycerophosphodiester phosphodiesterase family protein [uncultured Metabacillus sp.]|uniref:glycerophosphodiester phosphodiesterase n=1 Tax=uncultured Metabacillus sp. TaxID=2860135 RepID=UPI002626041A|nr:glycerophosphodiester phosphodiesterase family protein [uncultured Metabacillus sp.]